MIINYSSIEICSSAVKIRYTFIEVRKLKIENKKLIAVCPKLWLRNEFHLPPKMLEVSLQNGERHPA